MTSEEFGSLLRQILGPGFPLSPPLIHSLYTHMQLMLRWNQVINLTAVTSQEEAVDRHYAESLWLASLLPPGPWRVLDIGSGAGFPGIPIGLYHPEYRVTLLEAHRRKAAFLSEATRGMEMFRVVAARAEEFAERFDWVVSRAIAAGALRRHLSRLGERVAALTSTSRVEEWTAIPGWRWETPKPLPWSPGRVVMMGEVSRGTVEPPGEGVSRGT